MIQNGKRTRKTKRKYLQPCKYNEMASLDIDKNRLERYVIPLLLEVEGAAGKGKLDKKIVEAEEDLSDFYLKSHSGWRDMNTEAGMKSGYSDIYFRHDYN